MGIESAGTLPDGRPIKRIALSDGALSVHILTYGAIVQDIRLAPFDHSLILGFASGAAYLTDPAYIGAVVGRVANRIAGGQVHLGGQRYILDRNEGAHTLHGGAQGTSRLLWRILDHSPRHVALGLFLPDGHMGFPGALEIVARYGVCGGALEMSFEATAQDDMTLCNLAPHLYFTLDGQGDIRDHRLSINAATYLPTAPDGIPTGARQAVAGTPWDFRQPRRIGAGGVAYDHTFCLANARRTRTPALTLQAPRSGITMLLETTEPGVQVYDGAGLTTPHSGLALEPQGWPDAPNHSGFPSITLLPGASMHQKTRLVFTAPP